MKHSRDLRTIVFVLLGVAIIVQLVWVGRRASEHRSFAYALGVTSGFLIFALVRDRLRFIPGLLRMFVGFSFLSAVADRLGLFGGPGTPGVSWGNFQTFIAYTAQVNSFLPAQVIPALAVIESVIEGGLGALMLLGIMVRYSSWASAALLTAFAVAMTVSLGLASQFPFAVYVMALGTAGLALVDSSWFSVDAGREKRRRRLTGKATGAA